MRKQWPTARNVDPTCKPAKWSGSRRPAISKRRGTSSARSTLIRRVVPRRKKPSRRQGSIRLPTTAWLKHGRERYGSTRPMPAALSPRLPKKMINSWAGGELQAAIMLTNAYTETSWFHALVNASRAVCFTRGRIKFKSPHGEKCAPTNGQSFFYFGNELDLFRQHFADVGLVMVEAP